MVAGSTKIPGYVRGKVVVLRLVAGVTVFAVGIGFLLLMVCLAGLFTNGDNDDELF
jgi:hypothetical protein